MNLRINKKYHTQLMPDFLLACSEDSDWQEKLKALAEDETLDTDNAGMPSTFTTVFAKEQALPLRFCIERVSYEQVPRNASSTWSVNDSTQYFLCYPAQFPQAALYLAIDFSD